MEVGGKVLIDIGENNMSSDRDDGSTEAGSDEDEGSLMLNTEEELENLIGHAIMAQLPADVLDYIDSVGGWSALLRRTEHVLAQLDHEAEGARKLINDRNENGDGCENERDDEGTQEDAEDDDDDDDDVKNNAETKTFHSIESESISILGSG